MNGKQTTMGITDLTFTDIMTTASNSLQDAERLIARKRVYGTFRIDTDRSVTVLQLYPTSETMLTAQAAEETAEDAAAIVVTPPVLPSAQTNFQTPDAGAAVTAITGTPTGDAAGQPDHQDISSTAGQLPITHQDPATITGMCAFNDICNLFASHFPVSCLLLSGSATVNF